MPGKRLHSLQVKTGAVVLLAIGIGIAAFLGIQRAGEYIIQTGYMSEEKCALREQRYLKDFERFVEKEDISSEDTASIKNWCKHKEYVYLLVYKGNKLYYETDGTFLQSYSVDESEEEPDTEKLYPIRLSDGTYGISIIEFSEDRYYNILNIVSLVTAIVLFVSIVLIYNNRIIGRILKLSKYVESVRDGDIKREIEAYGGDELSRLQNDVNDMRESIIMHYEGEQEAIKANNELLTSISHDIRTPLTSLMVYADALAAGQIEDKDDVIRYASICRDKAYQLKDLTDTLFKYFFVYDKREVELNKEVYSASTLLQQLMGEHVVFLQQQGYSINMKQLEKDCMIQTDAAMLNRVFDNVFSNLEKYADKSRQINISEEITGTFLKIQIKNYNTIKIQQAESTKIGLKTCQRIMEILGGDFIHMRNKDSFIIQVIMPIIKGRKI